MLRAGVNPLDQVPEYDAIFGQLKILHAEQPYDELALHRGISLPDTFIEKEVESFTKHILAKSPVVAQPVAPKLMAGSNVIVLPTPERKSHLDVSQFTVIHAAGATACWLACEGNVQGQSVRAQRALIMNSPRNPDAVALRLTRMNSPLDDFELLPSEVAYQPPSRLRGVRALLSQMILAQRHAATAANERQQRISPAVAPTLALLPFEHDASS